MLMKKRLKKILIKLIPNRIENFIIKNYVEKIRLNYGTISYAQEGEDLILKNIFKRNIGFYIEQTMF